MNIESLAPGAEERVASVMEHVIRFINHPEKGWHLMLLVIFTLIGRLLMYRTPRLNAWGWRIALMTLLASLLIRICSDPEPSSPDVVFNAVLASLLIAGLVLGVVWIVFAPLAFLYEYAVCPIMTFLRTLRERSAAARAHRAEQRRLAREAPERARQQRELERRSKADADAQRRREAARAQCQLEFARHALEIDDRFSRADYDAYVQHHLSDNQPPEVVEARSLQFLAMIADHVRVATAPKPLPPKRNLANLTKRFQEEKREVEALDIDPEEKQQIIAHLYARFTQLQEELVRSMQL